MQRGLWIVDSTAKALSVYTCAVMPVLFALIEDSSGRWTCLREVRCLVGEVSTKVTTRHSSLMETPEALAKPSKSQPKAGEESEGQSVHTLVG